MHATSEVHETEVPTKLPADTVGECFAVEAADRELLLEDGPASEAGPALPIDAADMGDALLGELTEAEDFEESVRRALAAVGGELLFQMRLENVADCRHVAAISLGTGAERRIALVILPPEGAMRIEPVEGSSNPVAGIARSYFGLIEAYKAAA